MKHTYLRTAAPTMGMVSAAALWGLSFVSTKVLLGSLAPVQIAFLRHLLASAATWIAVGVSRQPLAVSRCDLPRMAAAAIIGIPVYFYFENTGLLYLSASAASMITASTPAMTAVMESVVDRKRLPGLRWLGIAISAAGVALVARSGASHAASLGASTTAFAKGVGLILTSSFAWSLYTIVNRPLAHSYGVLTTNAYQISAATAILGIAALRGGIPWRAIASDANTLLNLAYLGVLCSALAYGLYLYGLRSLGPTTASVFINLVPVFGVMGSTWLLGESTSPVQLVGGIVVILGILLVEKPQGGRQ